MKKNSLEIPAQYIVNNIGKKTGVILNISIFEKIMERLEESYLGEEAEKIFAEKTEYVDLSKVHKKLLSKK